MGIEDTMLECWDYETEYVQDDQLGNKDRVKQIDKKDYEDLEINFWHTTKLVWTKANEETKDRRRR